MIDRSSRQAGYFDGFFGIVEEDKEIVTSLFTKRAVLSADEVITTTAPVIIRMSGFDPCLTGFNLYGASLGWGDINNSCRVHGDVKN